MNLGTNAPERPERPQQLLELLSGLEDGSGAAIGEGIEPSHKHSSAPPRRSWYAHARSMVNAFDVVLAQALKLPSEDRRALVAHVLETLEPGYAEYDPACGETIQRRLAAIADGSATVVPCPATHQQIASDKMRDDLGEALDVGIAELDRGQGIESSIDEFMAELDAAVGLAP